MSRVCVGCGNVAYYTGRYCTDGGAACFNCYREYCRDCVRKYVGLVGHYRCITACRYCVGGPKQLFETKTVLRYLTQHPPMTPEETANVLDALLDTEIEMALSRLLETRHVTRPEVESRMRIPATGLGEVFMTFAEEREWKQQQRAEWGADDDTSHDDDDDDDEDDDTPHDDGDDEDDEPAPKCQKPT